MARLNETDLNKVCRTCLSLSECTKSLYEASSSSTLVCLADILMSFTPLKCYAHDGLPAQICDQCTSELNRFQTFQTKCLESDGILRNPVDIVKIEEINNPLNITELEQLNSNAVTSSMIISDNNIATNSLTKPLTNKEIEKELSVDIDLIKHEINVIDVKSEIDVNESSDSLIRNDNRENDVYPCTFSDSTFKKEGEEKAYACDGSFQQTHHGKKSKLTLSEVRLRKRMEEKTYICKFCNISFEHKESLMVHVATHTGKTPFLCIICDSTFTQRTSLMNHMRRHTGNRPYACTVCNSTFTIRSLLSMHMQLHTGEKPYSCSVCNRAFRQNYILTAHMRTHAEEKPYACTMCDTSFKYKRCLTTHMWRHTGKKPYPCTLCDKSFSAREYFRVHMRKHTGQKS